MNIPEIRPIAVHAGDPVPCPSCSVEGALYFRAGCHRCLGRGTVPFPFAQMCPLCQGYGKIESRGTLVTCWQPGCEAGWIEHFEVETVPMRRDDPPRDWEWR